MKSWSWPRTCRNCHSGRRIPSPPYSEKWLTVQSRGGFRKRVVTSRKHVINLEFWPRNCRRFRQEWGHQHHPSAPFIIHLFSQLSSFPIIRPTQLSAEQTEERLKPPAGFPHFSPSASCSRILKTLAFKPSGDAAVVQLQPSPLHAHLLMMPVCIGPDTSIKPSS